jgi:hypothetical protein
MSTPNVRSDVRLRIPVDHVTASLILHDGDRFDADVFVPPLGNVPQLITRSQRFVPVIRKGCICLIARDALACLAVRATPVIPLMRDLPFETQHASVRLRSGIKIVGELRWTAAIGHHRTADYLNSVEPYFEVHAANILYYVVKAHVATVEES